MSDYWDSTDQIFFTGGQGFGVTLELRTICLGAETEIIAFLNGGTYPDNISPSAKTELDRVKQIKGEMERESGNTTVKSTTKQRAVKSSGIRARPSNNSQHKPINTRQITPRKKIPHRKTGAKPGISGK